MYVSVVNGKATLHRSAQAAHKATEQAMLNGLALPVMHEEEYLQSKRLNEDLVGDFYEVEVSYKKTEAA